MTMRPSHILLALLLVTVWGCNFIAIQFSLNEMPPFLLCAVRFFFASVPIIFFVKRPAAPFYMVILYGLFTFGLQFGFLFAGMSLGMPPGLSSLVLQIQLFFSLILAIFFLNERPTRLQLFGTCIAFSGIGVVALQLDHSISFLSFSCVVIAALFWGGGNLIAKKIGTVSAIALVTWGSFVAFIPLTFVSLYLEGPTQIWHSLTHLSFSGIASTAYIVYLSTWVGYGAWNWLLKKYDVASVIPFALLVPVVGILSAALIFHEPVQPWKWLAAALILSGLSIHIFGPRWLAHYYHTIVPWRKKTSSTALESIDSAPTSRG